jgi:thiol-disulfide isomerase/thioredoxin
MTMRTIRILLIAGLCAALCVSCAKKPAEKPRATGGQKAKAPAEKVTATDIQADKTPVEAGAKAKIGDAAGSLAGLEFVKGGPVTIEKGKIYVVEFWATWCPPCRQSIPHLTEVAAKVKDKGVQIIGVSNETPETVKPFVEKMADTMNYVVAIDAGEKVAKAYMEAYGCQGIPTAFIVDAASKVVWFGHPMADMEEVLDKVIAGTFDAAAYAKKKAEEEAAYEVNVAAYKAYFETIKSGTMEEARAAIDKRIEAAPADMLNALAWQILTEVEEAKRDKALALRAAEKANTLTEGKQAAILDTYALALFVNGKAAEAVAAQEKAIELAKGDDATVADMTKRLEEFKAAGKI